MAAPPPDVLVSPPLLPLTPRRRVALPVLLLRPLLQLGRVEPVPRLWTPATHAVCKSPMLPSCPGSKRESSDGPGLDSVGPELSLAEEEVLGAARPLPKKDLACRRASCADVSVAVDVVDESVAVSDRADSAEEAALSAAAVAESIHQPPLPYTPHPHYCDNPSSLCV